MPLFWISLQAEDLAALQGWGEMVKATLTCMKTVGQSNTVHTVSS